MADYIRPTPRNPILGLLADALTGGVEWMRDPRRAQQMQGLGGLLAETGIPAVVERLSYGEPLTTGRGMTTRLRPEAEAALMTLGPEAVPIGRGTMAAVRATKGLPVGAATVYHGSPYRFQRFDPTKIGSGEGAQAYGYGHYVAESPMVADQYRVALSYDPEKMKVGGRQINEVYRQIERSAARLPPAKAQAEYEKLDLLERLMMNTNLPDVRAAAAEMSPATKNWFEKTVAPSFQTYGSLYTIDLPDPAIARMLDWDKKFSEQPENVQRGILKYWSENPGLKYYGRPEQMTGEGIYGSVKAASLGPEGGARINLNPANQAAAMDLRYQGIPGIRYLDQGSRSNFRVQNTYKGQPYGEPVSFMTEKQAQDYAAEQTAKGFGTNILPGTSNFVVFPGEEDLLRILSVNGGLLGP